MMIIIIFQECPKALRDKCAIRISGVNASTNIDVFF